MLIGARDPMSRLLFFFNRFFAEGTTVFVGEGWVVVGGGRLVVGGRWLVVGGGWGVGGGSCWVVGGGVLDLGGHLGAVVFSGWCGSCAVYMHAD